MNDLATQTWHDVVDGDLTGLRQREDTFSDAHLLKLRREFPFLGVKRYTQNEEAKSGADWEWWIGNRLTGWVSLRIQGKRCDGGLYKRLDHPGELPGEYQYDTLIRSAKAEPLLTVPYYVFFNGWADGWPSRARWTCCPNGRDPIDCKHFVVEDHGCAVAPAEAVAALHMALGRRRHDVEPYLSSSLPWSCLFGIMNKRPHSLGLPVITGTADASDLISIHRGKLAAFQSRSLEVPDGAAATLRELEIDDRPYWRTLPAYAQETLDASRNVAQTASISLDNMPDRLPPAATIVVTELDG